MHKFIYILFFALCLSPAAQAQDTEEYDTTLTPNQLAIPADSIEHWKNLKSFEYAKWLDSLLKLKQEKENLKFSSSAQKKARSTTASPSTYTEPEPNWLDKVFASPITKIIFWILAAIFILFILYKLFLANTIFRKKSRTAPVTETEEAMVTAESDFDTLINQAVRGGNFRMAVRYQYLQLLHKLADKHLIEMAADKTNYQYVREVAGRGAVAVSQQFQNDFASLTLSYEYVWYGEFAIDADIYRKIATGFTQFNQKL